MKKGVKFLSGFYSVFKKYNLFLTILTISIIFSACTSSKVVNKNQDPLLEAPIKPTYKTEAVKKGSIERTFNGAGRMKSAYEQDLSFKISCGYLKSINVQQGDRVKKGDIIAELDCTDIENDLKEQEVRLKMAELHYNGLVSKGADSYEIKSAALNVEIEKVGVKKLKDKLSQKNLVSNMNGIVTFINNLKIGDTVIPYTTVAIISDTDHLLVEYSGDYAPGLQSTNDLKIGMKVQLEYKGKQYTGKIVSSPLAKKVSSTMYDNAEVSTIFIAIDNFKDKSAVIGDNVKLYIQISKLDNVLKVPIAAVHSFNGNSYVNVLENGEKIEKPVKVGLGSFNEVQIVSGLKEGEMVIID